MPTSTVSASSQQSASGATTACNKSNSHQNSPTSGPVRDDTDTCNAASTANRTRMGASSESTVPLKSLLFAAINSNLTGDGGATLRHVAGEHHLTQVKAILSAIARKEVVDSVSSSISPANSHHTSVSTAAAAQSLTSVSGSNASPSQTNTNTLGGPPLLPAPSLSQSVSISMSMTFPGGSKNSSFASATAAASIGAASEATAPTAVAARSDQPLPNPARSASSSSPVRLPPSSPQRSSVHPWAPTTASIIETGATPHGTLSHASNSCQDQQNDPNSLQSPSTSNRPSLPQHQQHQQQSPLLYTNPVSTPHTTVFASHSRRGSTIGFDASRPGTATSPNATMATANNNPSNRDMSTVSLFTSYGTAAPLPSTNVLYNDPASASVLDALRGSMAGTFESMTNGPRSIDSSNSASSRLRPELLADAIASHPMHRPLLLYHMTRYIFFSSVEPARSVDPNAPSLAMMLATDRLDQALATIASLVHQDSGPWTELAVALAVWLAGDTTDALLWFRGAMLQAFPARPSTSPETDSSATDKPVVVDGLVSEWGMAVCTKMLRILRLTGDIDGMEQVLCAWSRATLRSVDPKDTESKVAVDFVRHLALACALDDAGKHTAARKHWAAMFPDAFTDPTHDMNEEDSPSLPGAETPTATNTTGSIPLGLADPAVHRLADHLLATLPVSCAYETILDVISISNLSMTQFAPLLTVLALSAGRQDSAAGYTIMWTRSRGVQSDNWASMWAPLMGALASTSCRLPPNAMSRRIANWGDPCDAALLTDVVGMWIRAHGSVKGLQIPGKPNDSLCPSVHATAQGFDIEVPATAIAGVGLLGGVVRVAGRWAFDREGRFLEPVVLRDHRQNGGGIADCGMEPVVIESVEHTDGSTKKIRSLILWFDHLVAIDTRLDGSEKSSVLDVRSLSSIIKSQGVLPLAARAQVRLEQKHRWTRNVVSLMGTYVIQRKPSATSQSVDSDDILADEDGDEPFSFFHPIHLLPSSSESPNVDRILHPEVPPYPVAPTYLEFLMDPPRSVFIDNTPTTVENKPALAVTLTWEMDHLSGKRRYTSHVFHIDQHTATFTPVDVLVNFRLCIATANQWTIGLIPGSRPQIVKLDAGNKEIQRVTVGVLTPVHPPAAGAAPSVAKGINGGSSSLSKSTNSPSSSSKPAPPPCALEYWPQVQCAIFIAYTMVVVYSIDSMAVIMQLEFSGSNNPRETLHERSLTVCDKSQTHLVVAAGRNLFVLHSPEDDPLAGMTLACYIPLPALPNHVHCELDRVNGMVRVVHILTAGTGSSQYFRFVVGAQLVDSGMGGVGSPDPLKVTGVVALRGWNTCVRVRNLGADVSGPRDNGRGCMVIADPTGVMLLQDRKEVFNDAE